MTTADLLTDAFGRVDEVIHSVLDDVDEGFLTARLDPDANTLAWLVWHIARLEDDHIAEVDGSEQLWTRDGWVRRFGFPFDDEAVGYGFSRKDVRAVVAPAGLLLAYADATHGRVLDYLRDLTDDDLARVVDKNWDPPVTLSVRLVSVLADALQHAGQAAYVRGVLERRASEG